MLSRFISMGAVLIGSMMMLSPAQAEPQQGGYHGGGARIECGSRDYRFTRCDVGSNEVNLVRQTSSARCIRGQTWGVDRRGLWVDRGCAGIFAVDSGYGGNPGGWQPGPDWNTDIRLTCESRDYRYRFCSVDIGPAGRVRIERQISETACIEGRTWGANRAGIWVSGGCAAYFFIGRRWN